MQASVQLPTRAPCLYERNGRYNGIFCGGVLTARIAWMNKGNRSLREYFIPPKRVVVSLYPALTITHRFTKTTSLPHTSFYQANAMFHHTQSATIDEKFRRVSEHVALLEKQMKLSPSDAGYLRISLLDTQTELCQLYVQIVQRDKVREQAGQAAQPTAHGNHGTQSQQRRRSSSVTSDFANLQRLVGHLDVLKGRAAQSGQSLDDRQYTDRSISATKAELWQAYTKNPKPAGSLGGPSRARTPSPPARQPTQSLQRRSSSVVSAGRQQGSESAIGDPRDSSKLSPIVPRKRRSQSMSSVASPAVLNSKRAAAKAFLRKWGWKT